MYDNPGNPTLTRKLESVQYNASLAITGCFRGTSRNELYAELGLESLADRRYSRKLVLLYKIVHGLTPSYLLECLPVQHAVRPNLRTNPAIRPLTVRTERYRNSFFPFLDRNGTTWIAI